ncbi:MAG TPA: GTP cyclohydrolase I FolE [Verrucomicrobiae bacterium]|nr:GTP cyclohydrolase I FolE [Verrucomicrobiae bacterium]
MLGPVAGEEMEDAVRTLLRGMGEDPERPGLLATPHRVATSLAFLTQGYQVDVDALLRDAVFRDAYDEMVVVRDIALHSLCEHHLLPFHGVAHVAYLPAGRLVGLSKLVRIVEAFARRLQVQERLTTQVAEAIEHHLAPRGVGVVVEAFHLCISMRGVEKPGSRTVTSCMRGTFRSDPRTRAELLQLLRPGG